MTGKEIKEKRISLGLSQKELATLIGVGKNTIYNYESGGKIPDSKIPILELALNPNIGKEENKENSIVLGADDLIAQKVLDRFEPAIKKILESHQNSKDATNRLSILISMLMDKVEELEEKIDRIEKNQSTILDKVS